MHYRFGTDGVVAKLTRFFVALGFLYVSFSHIKHDLENLVDIFSNKPKVETLSEIKDNSNLLKTYSAMDENNVINQDENPKNVSDTTKASSKKTKNQLA